MSTTVLLNNRLISVHDYCKTFNKSYPTASKMLELDRTEYQIKRFTVITFFEIYGSYPRGFIPQLQAVKIKEG